MKRVKIIALAVSLLAMLSLWMYLGTLEKGGLFTGDENVEVVVAASDIQAHELITADKLTVKNLPASTVHPDAVTDINSAVGRLARSQIIQGEVLLSSRVVQEEDRAALGMAYVIPNGMRGFSVDVEYAPGVSALLQVGNYVDVIFIGEATYHIIVGGDKGDVEITKKFSKLLLQDIKIVSLGSSYIEGQTLEGTQNENTYMSATLELAPDDASKLALAISSGEVWLALRPQGDHEYVESPDFLIDDIVDRAKIIDSFKFYYAYR